MATDDTQKNTSPSGAEVLRPMSAEQLAALPRLSPDAVRQALQRGARAIAAAEASAIVPSGYPKVRLR